MEVQIREAGYGNDVLEIAELLCARAGSKTDPHICRSRVTQMVSRSKKMKKVFSRALVAEKGSQIVGFLYAEERAAFDLVPKTAFIELSYLFGGKGCALPLLRRLRAETRKRILVQSWAILSNMRSMERLLRPLRPQVVGRIYQLM